MARTVLVDLRALPSAENLLPPKRDLVTVGQNLTKPKKLLIYSTSIFFQSLTWLEISDMCSGWVKGQGRSYFHVCTPLRGRHFATELYSERASRLCM